MRLHRIPLVVTAFILLSAAARAQNFTAGDLVVYRVGNGTAALTNTATPVFLDEYNVSSPTTPVLSIALPTSGGNLITAEGTAINEGQLSLSANGQYLAFAGYSEAVGGSKPSNTNPTSTQRVGATISGNGTLTVTPMGTSAFVTNNVRGAYSTNGTNLWVAGAGSGNTGGVWYTNGTGSPVQLPTSPGPAVAATRYVTAMGGQLLVNTGTAIQAVGTGLPTTTGQTSISFNLTTSGNSASFFMADLSNAIAGPDTLYVTSTNSTANSFQKFTLTSGNFYTGTWVNSGNIALGTLGNGNGTLGLTGVADANGNVTIYGTSSSTLFDLVDTSGYDGTLTGTPTVLATASGNEAFRGLALAPSAVPEPGETAALLGAATLLVAGCHRRRKLRVAAAPANDLD